MMAKKLGLIVGLLLVASISFGQQQSQFFEASDAVFMTFVNNGKVDYKALKASPDKLDKALNLAKDLQIAPSKIATYKAFWINAYNLAVLKGVVNNMPINSPLEVPGFFDKNTFDLGGMSITLNDIENKILRPVVNDARIHFALVCGANGCPPLIDKAYTPTNIDGQLEIQAVIAINNPEFIQLKDGVVLVSEIFKWYNEDFVSGTTTVIDYLNDFRSNDDDIPKGTTLKYHTYDWRLNAL